MSQYPGISPQAMWLLAENRFHDSREFYEAHKDEIRHTVLEPLGLLAQDLAPFVQTIDPQILTNPRQNGCVSRIRRDNRYSRDKSMYRENVWMALLRDKKAGLCLPGFYLDFSLRAGSWGMGFYQVTPAYLQVLRRRIDETPAPFLKAVQQALDAGFEVQGERYARPKKDGLPALLDTLYNRKNLDFTKDITDASFGGDPALPDILQAGFTALAPMYRLLVQAAEAEFAARERG